MIAASQLLDAIVKSLREVIAPAIDEPYPKSQAYMAAVILELVSRQIAGGQEIEQQKRSIVQALYRELSRVPQLDSLVHDDQPGEAQLSELIERLYLERDRIGEEAFIAANQSIRQALRQMVDQELKIAGKAES